MNVEKYKKWARIGLEGVIALLALGLAFGAGVLAHSRVGSVVFSKTPPRLSIDVVLQTNGTAKVTASDTRGFTVAGPGVSVVSDEKKSDILKVSGLQKELRLFNDVFDVVLHVGDVSVTSSSEKMPPVDGGSVGEGSGVSSRSGKIVASSRGKKYYFADCPEVKQIKPENLVSFDSVAEAKAVGLTASQCVLEKDN